MTEKTEALLEGLEPCPFCGSEETFTKTWQGENGGTFALARCSRCGAQGNEYWPTEGDAAAAWNKRPDRQRLQAERDEARAALEAERREVAKLRRIMATPTGDA
jgi:Lar family restriction alleviation protein